MPLPGPRQGPRGGLRCPPASPRREADEGDAATGPAQQAATDPAAAAQQGPVPHQHLRVLEAAPDDGDRKGQRLGQDEDRAPVGTGPLWGQGTRGGDHGDRDGHRATVGTGRGTRHLQGQRQGWGHWWGQDTCGDSDGDMAPTGMTPRSGIGSVAGCTPASPLPSKMGGVRGLSLECVCPLQCHPHLKVLSPSPQCPPANL